MMLLYEADSKSLPATEVLAAQISPADELTTLLVEGVEHNQTRLDEAIAAQAKGWTLARMPTIDRSVLRIAGFELLGRPDVPVDGFRVREHPARHVRRGAAHIDGSGAPVDRRQSTGPAHNAGASRPRRAARPPGIRRSRAR